jgi:outer membrane protein OmpA-like peptidoglycan-associated protein
MSCIGATRLVALMLLIAGCARVPSVARPSPPARADLYVLVPGPDGKVGAVTVIHGAEQRTLESAYATARIADDGRLEIGRTTEAEARQIFGAALSAQPPRPMSFTLFFAFGTDVLTPDSVQALGQAYAEASRRPAAEVIVIGHTDRVGSVQQNDALSLQRAERIRRELVGLGMANEQISTVGRGEREPLVATDDEVAEPRNRRVEITVR